MRSLISALALLCCACAPEAGPDPQYVYGGWVDEQGNIVRFRGLQYGLPGVIGASYIDGRVEWNEGGQRRVGVWNYAQTRPFLVLNVAPPGEKPEFWGFMQAAPDRATVWISRDAAIFTESDWQRRAEKRELRRLDAEMNPEPKLTPQEAALPTSARPEN